MKSLQFWQSNNRSTVNKKSSAPALQFLVSMVMVYMYSFLLTSDMVRSAKGGAAPSGRLSRSGDGEKSSEEENNVQCIIGPDNIAPDTVFFFSTQKY